MQREKGFIIERSFQHTRKSINVYKTILRFILRVPWKFAIAKYAWVLVGSYFLTRLHDGTDTSHVVSCECNPIQAFSSPAGGWVVVSTPVAGSFNRINRSKNTSGIRRSTVMRLYVEADEAIVRALHQEHRLSTKLRTYGFKFLFWYPSHKTDCGILNGKQNQKSMTHNIKHTETRSCF